MELLECILTALYSLSQNKVRAFLTTLGVIIGVMSVILLVALGEAAQAYVQNEFAGMGSNVIAISPGKQETTSNMIVVNAGSYRKLTRENAKEIKRKGIGLKGVSGNVLGTAQVKYVNLERNCLLLGVMEDFFGIRELKLQLGRFINAQDIDKNNKVCVVGEKIRRDLFGAKPVLNEKISINRMKHVIVGVLEERGTALGINLDDIVFVPLPSGQEMFYGGEDKVFEIIASARSPEDIPLATRSIKEILYAAHDYNEDFTIIDQDSMIGSFGKIFDMLRFMLAGVACISLFVGGIGIMNIMLVSVRERIREVGIRKAVGAKRKDIGLQFLIEAVTLSVCGGIVGILIAWMGTLIIGFIYPSLPVRLSMWSVLMAFFFSLSVGVFFGVYPALKASSVDPVEALRYE
ncbi:MAG: ABC transporter permease [Armatimonadetes bacterium]|nr:ABC transporter permease [Armatimonadota bacterium]